MEAERGVGGSASGLYESTARVMGIHRWGEVIAHAMIESKEVDAPVTERTYLFRVPYYGLYM